MTGGFDPARMTYPPEAERALAGSGLSLARWYDLALGRDPALAGRIERGSGHHFRDVGTVYSCDGRAVLERRFLEHQTTWPVVLAGYDLFVEWCDTGGARFASTDQDARAGLLDHLFAEPQEYTSQGLCALQDARAAARAVAARFEAMIGLLRSGALEAWGHHRGGSEARISPAVWEARKTRIDFNENEIHTLTAEVVEGDAKPWRHRKLLTEPVWSGVVVRRPAGAIEVSTERQKSKGGREAHIPWARAFDHMLVKIIRDQDYPESAAEMARHVEAGFEAVDYESPDVKDIKKNIKKLFPLFYDKCLKRGD